MNFSIEEIAITSMILFAVVDIIGSIPLIIALKQKGSDIKPFKVTVVSLFIMIAFLFLGESILNVIGVDVKSFSVAGAFVLFFMALEMILGIELFKSDETTQKSASIVPLAFPIIAGAGSMTSLLSLRAEYESMNIVVAILINMIVVYIVLKLTNQIERLLGPGGIAVMKKVFGIILLAIAVKLFSANIKALLS